MEQIRHPNMGIWQGVAMDSLKFHQGPPCRWATHTAVGLHPSSTPLDTPCTPRHTPMRPIRDNSKRNENVVEK
jgi:hypothetical protein